MQNLKVSQRKRRRGLLSSFLSPHSVLSMYVAFFSTIPWYMQELFKNPYSPTYLLIQSFLSRLSCLSIAYLIVVSYSRLLKPIVVLLNAFAKTTPALGIVPVW